MESIATTQELPVAILLATFNGARYLPELLDSIESQTHRNIQVYIRDDVSTDSTMDILRKYQLESRFSVKIFVSDRPSGSAGGNFSLLSAENFKDVNYFLFADQDDIWLQRKVESYLSKILEVEQSSRQLEPVAVFSDLVVVDESRRIIADSFWRYQKINPSENSYADIVTKNVLTGCACIFNRRALDLAFPMPEKSLLHDWWLALVVSRCGRLEFLSDPYVLYRQHSDNVVGAREANIFSVIKRLADFKVTVIHLLRCYDTVSASGFSDGFLVYFIRKIYRRLLDFRL